MHLSHDNGLCEHSIKTFEEELCWWQRFVSLEHAKKKIQAWIHNAISRAHPRCSITETRASNTNYHHPHQAKQQPDYAKILSKFHAPLRE